MASAIYSAVALIIGFLLFKGLLFTWRVTLPREKESVTIVVLGDVGRSPRMMYHAGSFASRHWRTRIIGYDGRPSVAYLWPV